MSTIHFTLFNEATQNNISGITYLAKPASSKDDIFNPTPYHIFMGHATGFCKEIYSDMIMELRKLGVNSPITAIDMINHGDSTRDLPSDWHYCASDVYQVIDKVIRQKDPNKKLIGTGHSMGATVCSIVEAANPGTFACLILCEPILYPPPFERIDSPLAKMTMKRKSIFPSKQAIYEAFSSKPPFNTWTKGSLDSYINHGFKQSVQDGKQIMELKIPKEQEAEFYRMGSAHGAYALMPKLQVPILIIRGAQSNFTYEFYQPVVDQCKNACQEVVDGDHFFPMQYPSKVADMALQFVKRHVVEGSSRSTSKL